MGVITKMNNIDFQKHFSSVSRYSDDSYLHSFLYYKITGRKSAWLYKNKEGFLVVCQHPHEPQTLLVFAEVGRKSFDLTADVLQSLYRSEHQIRLARYTSDDLGKLQTALARRDVNLIDRLQVVEETEMDWRYPVHIYDTHKVAMLEGRDFKPVRTKFNKVEAKGITVELMDKRTAVKDMRAALKYWEGSMIAEGKDTEEMTEFYERFFNLLNTYDGKYDGLLFFQGRRPVGFSVWDQINSETANSFINLADISVLGLSDYQIVTMCRLLNEKGVKYLNVGGSENESLNQFKLKFQPVKSVDLLSVDVVYKTMKSADIQYSKFV